MAMLRSMAPNITSRLYGYDADVAWSHAPRRIAKVKTSSKRLLRKPAVRAEGPEFASSACLFPVSVFVANAVSPSSSSSSRLRVKLELSRSAKELRGSLGFDAEGAKNVGCANATLPVSPLASSPRDLDASVLPVVKIDFFSTGFVNILGPLRSFCAGVIGAGGTLYQNGLELGPGSGCPNTWFGAFGGPKSLKARCLDCVGDQSISSEYWG